MSQFDELVETARGRIEAAVSPDALRAVRSEFLGSEGALGRAFKSVDMGSLPVEARKQVGAAYNAARRVIENAVVEREAALSSGAEHAEPISFDPTLIAPPNHCGSIHPIISTQIEIEDIFRGMGFQVMVGNEVVTEFENFDSVNVPGDHPARDMQDTFWLENGAVLRTHTSAMQHHALRRLGAPLRAIFPGRCYRNEATDLTHENTFYQLEGMVVGSDISVANLIAVMKELLDKMFKRDTKVRLRPGYFPFVEPGFELDFWTRVGGKDRWLELMPCGIIHRNVLLKAGLDPEVYSGFAFGLGLTRLAMLKYSIPDVRLFNKGDLRFSAQFPPTL